MSDEYALGRKLGTGSYAVVREGMNKMTRDRFAVKIIDKKHAKESRLKSEVWALPSAIGPCNQDHCGKPQNALYMEPGTTLTAKK